MGGRVDATWRLGRVASHLQAASAVEEPAPPSPYEGGFIVTSLLEPPPPPPPLAAAEPPAPGLDDEQLAGYVARGFINLPRELIGLDPDHHRRVHAHHKAARLANGTAGHPYASWKGDNIFNHMRANPGVLEVINSPALVAAVGSILGPDWAIVPYANSVIEADAGDQHWHKDDIFPWNARKPGLRQHHLEHLNLFYYPQDVTELMGPTAMIPYSHYWTVDHDENNANICIEMLHPISMHSDPDLAQRDARLNGAVHDTGWPLVRQVQTCARGGSVTLMSQNVFHRRNRRRDSPEEIEANPRYMWRFMCYRTTEPLATAAAAAASECGSESDGAAVHGKPESRADQLLETWVVNGGSDEMTGAVLARGGEAEPLCSVWASVLGWARGEPAAVGSVSPSMSEAAAVAALAVDLRSKGAEHEPARIDAAYRLGALCNATFTDCSGLFAAALPTQAATAAVASLADAMSHSWEGVRRAATHGLISAGGHCTAAEEALLALCDTSYPSKYVRKNAAFALGEMAFPHEDVVAALVALLRSDDSVHVRATAATAIGGVGRRARQLPGADTSERAGAAATCLLALLESLAVEDNRVGQDITQGVGPYDFKVTDQSDLCEGASGGAGTVEYVQRQGQQQGQRFQRVRSGVKEAAGWGVVMLCTNAVGLLAPNVLEQAADALSDVIQTDDNVIVVGFAMDALTRLAAQMGEGSRVRAAADLSMVEAEGWANKESLCRAMGDLDSSWRERAMVAASSRR